MSETTDYTAPARPADRIVAEAFVVAAIAGWWLTALAFPNEVLPSPPEVFRQLGSMLIDPAFLKNVAATAVRVFIAVIIATVIGTALALLPRYVDWTHDIVHAIAKPVLTSFPSVGWAILGTIWFGVSGFSVLWIQVLILVPFCLINVSEGIKEIDQESVEMGRSFGRSRFAIFWHIEFPMLTPFILAAARMAYGVGWKISLVAELFGASLGMGVVMFRAQESGQTVIVMAVCLAIVFFFFLGEKIIFRYLSRIYRTS